MSLNFCSTKDYDNNLRLLPMAKQTQTKPILPAMAGKIAPLLRMSFILMGPDVQ
jgi:hypothetical protein